MTSRLEYLWKSDMHPVGKISVSEEERKAAHEAILRLAQKTRAAKVK